jgi:hypothetical protein
MDLLAPVIKGLKGPLLLLLGICILCGVMFLKAEGTPPRIPVGNKVSVIVVWILAIFVAGWLYYKDRRLDAAETQRREAEEANRQLPAVLKSLLATQKEQRDVWTRPMLHLPLQETVVEKVFRVFNATLDEAARSVRDLVPDADCDNIRANIFLPTSEGARDGDVCNLVIPSAPFATEGVQVNMKKGDEIKITFRPNQGATGRVFVEKRAIGVLTHPKWLEETDTSKRKEIERWIYVQLHPNADLSQRGDALKTELGKSPFEMPDFTNRRVAESLAWIISMPIFLETKEAIEVVGVFNVDCLEQQLKPQQLRAVYYRLAPFAGVLSGAMRGLSADRVAIFRIRGD